MWVGCIRDLKADNLSVRFSLENGMMVMMMVSFAAVQQYSKLSVKKENTFQRHCYVPGGGGGLPYETDGDARRLA